MSIQKRCIYSRTATNILLILLICVLYIATSEPSVYGVMAPVYRGGAKDKVALQCAVSWDADALTDMLDTLKSKGVSITFFISGEWAQKNGESLRRMIEEGHEIGTMGMKPGADGPVGWVCEDIEESISCIKRMGGVEPKLYYSGTRDTDVSSRAARKSGVTHVLCTVDLLCARGSYQDIVSRALDRPLHGSIMLMQPTKAAAQALPLVLDELSKKGFEITCTSQVISAG